MATVAAIREVSTPARDDVPTLPVYRFSVEQYFALVAVGILAGDERVELLDGWIVPKMTKNPPHVVATGQLLDLLRAIIPPGWLLTKEDPIAFPGSAPEPDIALVRGDRRDFTERHPTAGEVAILAEVAESSLARDRGEKLEIYSAAGIPCYWLVNLVDSIVEVFHEPTGLPEAPTYARCEVFGIDAEIPVLLDGREVGRVAVRDILP